MKGDRNKFITLNKNKKWTFLFGNDNGANIIGKGTVSLGTKKEKVENVLLMKGNLLTVS